MLQTENILIPSHIHVGLRRSKTKRVTVVGRLDFVDCGLSAKGVIAVSKYLHDFFAADFISFEGNYSFPFSALKIKPYLTVME
jgi:hypothetical protein